MVKIINWNVNGLRAILKKDIIKDNKKEKDNTFINFIKQYEVICLQEIKLCKKTIDNLLEILPEYNIYYNLPTYKKGYSGVAILSKLKPIKYSTKLDTDNEGRYIEIEFNKVYIVNVYKPNAGAKLERLNFKDKFDKTFQKKINQLKRKKEVILCGDFNAVKDNYGTYDYKSHFNKLSGVTEIEINNINKLIDNKTIYDIYKEKYPNKQIYSYFSYRFPARLHNKGLLIDFILTTKGIMIYYKKIKYLDNIYGSDHIPIMLELDNKIFI
jgi:exodeoxyribonuclease-3